MDNTEEPRDLMLRLLGEEFIGWRHEHARHNRTHPH